MEVQNIEQEISSIIADIYSTVEFQEYLESEKERIEDLNERSRLLSDFADEHNIVIEFSPREIDLHELARLKGIYIPDGLTLSMHFLKQQDDSTPDGRIDGILGGLIDTVKGMRSDDTYSPTLNIEPTSSRDDTGTRRASNDDTTLNIDLNEGNPAVRVEELQSPDDMPTENPDEANQGRPLSAREVVIDRFSLVSTTDKDNPEVATAITNQEDLVDLGEFELMLVGFAWIAVVSAVATIVVVPLAIGIAGNYIYGEYIADKPAPPSGAVIRGSVGATGSIYIHRDALNKGVVVDADVNGPVIIGGDPPPTEEAEDDEEDGNAISITQEQLDEAGFDFNEDSELEETIILPDDETQEIANRRNVIIEAFEPLFTYMGNRDFPELVSTMSQLPLSRRKEITDSYRGEDLTIWPTPGILTLSHQNANFMIYKKGIEGMNDLGLNLSASGQNDARSPLEELLGPGGLT